MPLTLAHRRRPRVVLHIGRNKAGSTTIQDFCLTEQAALAARRVDYGLVGHMAFTDAPAPGFWTFQQLAETAREKPRRTQFASNEFMFAQPVEMTRAIADALRGCEVSVLAYVRRYDDWLVSAYAEETRRAMNTRNIDVYLESMRQRISAWPHLHSWGETFGWNRLRVRALDATSLHGGELLTDVFHALRIRPIAHRPLARSNAAPHWLELELVRRLSERDGDADWAGAPREQVQPLAEVMAVAARATPALPYLTAAQRRELVALYNDDLKRIEAYGGRRLPSAPAPDAFERGPPPALEHAPQEVLSKFFEMVRTPEFTTQAPVAAARAKRLAIDMGQRD